MIATPYDTLDDTAVSRLAHQALNPYPASLQGQLQLLCRSENATFLLTAGGRRYALRLHRPGYHRQADIESELLWLDALRDSGMAVPEALEDMLGQRVQRLRLADGSCRYAVLFHWVEGEMPTTGVDPRTFRQLGEITARLHRHSRSWNKPVGFSRIIWDHQTMTGPQGHWGDWRDAPGLSLADRDVIGEALIRVEQETAAFGKAPDRYGLIHADLRLTNLLLYRGETRVIDFDDCGMGWYLHDLAAAFSFVEHHPRAGEWIENWLQGYEREAHLSDETLAMLPALVIQRRIQMTAWLGSHAATNMAQSLGADWCGHSVRLCRRYLTDQMPVGPD